MTNERADCELAGEELVRGAAKLGLSLSAAQQDQFLRYCAALMIANRRVNLTGARSPESIVRTLFLDSLTIAPALPRRLKDGSARRPIVIDVGTGAGIPGIPLKILYPHWSLALVESIGKKARFLTLITEELALPDVTILACRAEELGRDEQWRDSADLCLARAIAQLPTLIELCAPLVKPGGYLALPKSGDISAERRTARAAGRALRVEPRVSAPVLEGLGLGTGRVILLYEKTAATPAGYPRRTGLAKSRPIGH